MLGAHLDGRDNGDRAPLAIRGVTLRGGSYDLPVASAQVKSALLLAALAGDGPLHLTGLVASRDHTERMLTAMGVAIHTNETGITLQPPAQSSQQTILPAPLSLRIPGDPSSAAFWWVAAAIHPDAEITTPGVCLNPTRTGALDVLRAMGASITMTNERQDGSEPVGDITVRSSALHGTTIHGDIIPRLIDEIPVLAVAAACAQGETIIRDAQELRVKETDRVTSVVNGLHMLGAEAGATPDGMVVVGNNCRPLHGAVLHSQGDHRLAMAWGIAALAASAETTITDADAAGVSYPGFWEMLTTLGNNR
jgi:3-phosphoshikimate 1-carboxyvinyltransferase